MATHSTFEIFLACAPGLEALLCDEARDLGYAQAKSVPGGVTLLGTWRDVWALNLQMRGANRVLARFAEFRAMHLAQLDKRARKLPWADYFKSDVALRVEASCKRSRIYHAGAAAQRIGTAIAEEAGIAVRDDAEVAVMARIEDDLCTLSIDTSGTSLHKRGFKEAIAKAPMRETMAALFLRQCGYRGNEPVLDPMCGSGTFVIEAAEMALGLLPGRDRNFAFTQLQTFDASAWQEMRQLCLAHKAAPRFFGSDRDPGAIKASRENAERSGVAGVVDFQQANISQLVRPDGEPGLVIVNPPYGARIGDKSKLMNLHASLGQVLRQRFTGWRVGLVTSDKQLAYATGLKFKPPSAPVNHGGLRITLFQTDAL